ncbi:MAG TPA: hypothetical protein PLR32_06665 [candidate division Zixibacteria bacterium]|nr:hypothetical protein [candidate division Zixibacteria bacterium]HOD66318.1 hypothetical protein [candidate division Zixibacteria bacterium]HOZ07369.1 hypothetical protein [candidate division Zixibacteria bacterium]HPC10673.1 hypothetical protein [candidate division Zixibacteria bacterium]HPI32981.1 hypothetical protein [candidate division Zixibacteria bacterium]
MHDKAGGRARRPPLAYPEVIRIDHFCVGLYDKSVGGADALRDARPPGLFLFNPQLYRDPSRFEVQAAVVFDRRSAHADRRRRRPGIEYQTRGHLDQSGTRRRTFPGD